MSAIRKFKRIFLIGAIFFIAGCFCPIPGLSWYRAGGPGRMGGEFILNTEYKYFSSHAINAIIEYMDENNICLKLKPIQIIEMPQIRTITVEATDKISKYDIILIYENKWKIKYFGKFVDDEYISNESINKSYSMGIPR